VALNLKQKKAIVSGLSEMTECASVIAADYRGLTVAEMSMLRSKAHEAGIVVKVTQNTLARRAFANTKLEPLSEVLLGPTVLIFSPEDPGVSARLVRAFAKDHEKLAVKGLIVESEFLAPEQLKEVANLPTKEQAISTLLSVMMAPMNNLARTFSEVYGQFVRVLSRKSEENSSKKES
jgi:large subunit ribosomal protein L10